MVFLSVGLKHHETTVRIKSNNAGNISLVGSPIAIGAHSDSEFSGALIQGQRCAAQRFSPLFNIPSPSQ
jgi:hypothetical protein